MNNKRLQPSDRKDQILIAALRVAGKPGGWAALTRLNVALEVQCAESLVSKYFGTMISFKRTVMRAAIQTENLSIIAQGLASNDKTAQKAPPALKQKALATLIG